MPRDLSDLEAEIRIIKQKIGEKGEFTLEERREIIYEISEKLNTISEMIALDKRPKNKLLALIHFSRGVPKDEKWETRINSFLQKLSSSEYVETQGIDNLCWALYSLKREIDENKKWRT